MLHLQDLLEDFEQQIDRSKAMEPQVKQLKSRHADLKKENLIYKSKTEKHNKTKDGLSAF